MKLRLARHALGDAVVVAVEGELDLFTAPFLRDEVRDAIKQDGARLVLDLQQLSFMDSSGLSVLIEAWRLATSEGGGVSLAAPAGAGGPDPADDRPGPADQGLLRRRQRRRGNLTRPRVELHSVGGLRSGYGRERICSNHLRRCQRPR